MAQPRRNTSTRRAKTSAALLAGAGLLALCVIAIGLYVLMANRERLTVASETVGGPFTLLNAADHVVTDRDFRGRYMLVYFGYTFCPDICPTTLAAVTQALSQLGPRAAQIQPIFITVDPTRDTPSVMGRYIAAFSPKLIGLTGSVAQIHQAETAYHVVVQPGPHAADGAELINHSAVLYLMAPDGQFLAPLPADSTAAVLETDLARLVR